MPSMRDSIYQSFVLSHLVGRYELQREAERKAKSVERGAKGEKRKAKFSEFDLPDILQLAQEWFVKKKVINKLDFVKLSAEARWESFTVAKTSDAAILENFKGKLNAALGSGMEIDEFRTDMDKVLDSMGVTRLNPFHLDTVFLTNVMSGYSEGRRQVMDSLSADEFPYRQVLTVDDGVESKGGRVRDSHYELHEYVAAANDPVWDWLKTPFSYRCRCMITPVHVSEGLKPSGYTPDVRGKRGFEFLK